MSGKTVSKSRKEAAKVQKHRRDRRLRLKAIADRAAEPADMLYWVESGQDLASRPSPYFQPNRRPTQARPGRWVTLKDVRAGDILLNPDGSLTEVVEPAAGPSELPLSIPYAPRQALAGDSEGAVIRATLHHPLFVKDRGWVAAKDLRPGDLLRTADDRYVPITETFRNGDIEPVFNFAVADWHTYFADGVLVHNNSGDGETNSGLDPSTVMTPEDIERVTALPTSAPAGGSGEAASQLAGSKGIIGMSEEAKDLLKASPKVESGGSAANQQPSNDLPATIVTPQEIQAVADRDDPVTPIKTSDPTTGGGYSGGGWNPGNWRRAALTGHANASDKLMDAAVEGAGDQWREGTSGQIHTALQTAAVVDPTGLAHSTDKYIADVENGNGYVKSTAKFAGNVLTSWAMSKRGPGEGGKIDTTVGFAKKIEPDIAKKISQFGNKSLRDQKSVFSKLMETYRKHLQKYGQTPGNTTGETNRMERELQAMKEVLEQRGRTFDEFGNLTN